MFLSRYTAAYIKTPRLWNETILGIQQLPYHFVNSTLVKDPSKHDKFGYFIEKIVRNIILNDSNIELISNNLQINSTSRTLGEIDFLVKLNDHIFYIENAFKFYLYDPKITGDLFSQWIGPNRSDSLQHKLNHITTHQFPLINTPEAIHEIEKLGVAKEDIEQYVLFKGLLFVPYGMDITVAPLNKNAVVGSYFHFRDLGQFTNNKFYILKDKIDWILPPVLSVNWITHDKFKNLVHSDIENEKSVFAWRKDAKGNLFRHFITWW